MSEYSVTLSAQDWLIENCWAETDFLQSPHLQPGPHATGHPDSSPLIYIYTLIFYWRIEFQPKPLLPNPTFMDTIVKESDFTT